MRKGKNEKEKVKNEKKEQEKNEKKEQEKKEKKETPKSTRELRPKRNVAQYSPGVCAEVAAILDSTSLRKLIPKERAVLARFCAAHQIPVLSRDEVSCYMGDAPQKVMETDVKNRFVSEQHELSYPRTLKAFHGLLLEAKELQELAEAQGARRLVGVCLLMPCLVTNVATREASEGPLQDEDAGQDAEQYAEQDVEHDAEQDVEHDAEHYLVRYAGHDAEQYDAEQYDAEQYDAEQYDSEQYDYEAVRAVRRGAVRGSLRGTRRGAVRRGAVRGAVLGSGRGAGRGQERSSTWFRTRSSTWFRTRSSTWFRTRSSTWFRTRSSRTTWFRRGAVLEFMQDAQAPAGKRKP
nr:uncharacterized protein LOC113818502 [Penaeus vannamei]